MTALLEIHDLRLETAAGAIVDGVSFAIMPGEMLAVVGESGSGKTMVARSILQLLPPGIRRAAGTVTYKGEDVTAADQRRLRKLRGGEIGMVFQEPMVSLNPALTVGTQMREGLELHRRPGAAREQMVDMLRRVRIADPERALKAYPHQFSGGMRQRIMLASVMLLRPQVLIADEPTTALDTLSQREVMDVMVELARDHGTAVLLITHNLGLVARYADDAIVMRQGEIVDRGRAGELLRSPRHPYTRSLVAALPRRAERPAIANNATVLSVRSLVVRHGTSGLFRPEAPPAVAGVNLDVREGEVVAVVGGSGSGKTTLGRAILGLIPRAAGSVAVAGIDPESATRQELARFRAATQLVFQDPYSSLDPKMRLQDIVAEPLRHERGLTRAQRRHQAASLLEEVGLGGLGRRFPHALSGGQRQRAAILRAIIRRPRFLVADEPIAALDMTVQAQILRLFRTLQEREGFACLFISHDLAAVQEIADRVIVMDAGSIVEQGTCAQIFGAPAHAYTRALLAATPELDAVAAAKLAHAEPTEISHAS